jgi:group II intron reverse transcriptase/maturase
MVKHKKHQILLLRQRVRSTGLLEREPAMVKRWQHTLPTDGKGPKSEPLSPTLCTTSSLGKVICKHNMSSSAHLNNVDRSLPSTDVPKWLRRLNALAKLKTSMKAKSLWALVNEPDLWVAAYKKLATSPGSLTRGGDHTTIDGYSMKILNLLREDVFEGKYRIGLTRRVYIPKPQGGLRPLGVPVFRDRVVQEVFRSILEAVFEPRFSPNSHGFRPGRSQHTCMRQIRRDFRGTKWFIEGDISKCFDEINHTTLRKQLGVHIQDNRFIKAIYQGIKTKVLMPDRKIQDIHTGTPQGGICSPLLSNIALNQLDRFMSRLQRRIERGAKRKQNPKYTQAFYLTNKAKRDGNPSVAAHYRRISREVPYGVPADPNFARLKYVRYADDFLVGVIGSYELTCRVKELINRFLRNRLSLRLNELKTLITRAKGNTIPFLGFRIQHGPTIAMRFWRRYQGKWRSIRSLRDGDIRLLVDQEKVIRKLAENKFCDKAGKPKPNFRYLGDPQSYTVSKVSNIIRGIDNYYKIANNRRQATSRILNIVRSSVVKMFAAKFKLRTQRKVYAKAGKDLSRPLQAKQQTVGATDAQAKAWAEEAGGRLSGPMSKLPFVRYADIPKPVLTPLSARWAPNRNTLEQIGTNRHSHMDYLNTLRVRSGLGRTALEAECAMCGSAQFVEMHHIRSLKDLKGRTAAERIMIASNRKVIPLCWTCHKKHHGWKSRISK